jgi:hypothetical protein
LFNPTSSRATDLVFPIDGRLHRQTLEDALVDTIGKPA